MPRPITSISGNILALRIQDEIRDREMNEICKAMESMIATGEPVRLFIVVDHYPSFNSAESLYDDLRFVKLYADRIERLAVVGDKPWQHTWIALFGLFGGIRAEYFDRSQSEAALQWLTH